MMSNILPWFFVCLFELIFFIIDYIVMCRQLWTKHLNFVNKFHFFHLRFCFFTHTRAHAQKETIFIIFFQQYICRLMKTSFFSGSIFFPICWFFFYNLVKKKTDFPITHTHTHTLICELNIWICPSSWCWWWWWSSLVSGPFPSFHFFGK